MTDTPFKMPITEADMVPVRMFGQKATYTKDGLQVTAYHYNGKIYVDDVKIIGPRLVKDSHKSATVTRHKG